MASEPDLASAFLSRWGGAPPSAADRRELEGALRDAVVRGRAAWPSVPLDPQAFAAWLGERAAAGSAAGAAVAQLSAEALWLTCACARLVPEGLAAFDEGLLKRVPAWLAKLRPDAEVVDDTLQALREKLFVGTSATPAKIAQYGGQGSLESWLRVTAVRSALNLIEARRPREGRDPDEAVAESVAEPELDYIKQRYRDDFAAAFREAFAALPQRERALLRFEHVEQLTPARVGAIYGVHRTTAARWIEEAQAQLLAGTRERLGARLQLSPADCDSLLDLLKSRLHVTLGSLFRSGTG